MICLNNSNFPVLVEPTNFCFCPDNNTDCIENEDKVAFKFFVKKFITVIDELERNNLKVAISKELLDIYRYSAPISVYEKKRITDQKYRATVNLARDYLIRKLPKIIANVHEFGNHAFEIDVREDTINSTLDIHNTDLYTHWFDMVGLAFEKDIFSACLKSEVNSILCNDNFIIANQHYQEKQINVIEDIMHFKRTKTFQLKTLKTKISPQKNINIPCSGTGDHGSMWGPSINSIDDIPKRERTLLKKLINTGLVQSITLLDFNDSYNAIDTPEIIIKRYEEMQDSDLLYCVLRGKGVKQNAQNIKIQILSGNGKLLYEWFNQNITLNKLELLFQESAGTLE